MFYEIFEKIYIGLNNEKFPDEIEVPKGFEKLINLVYEFHKQKQPIIKNIKIEKKEIKENNKILIAYSGGLDSAYAPFYFIDKGYEPILFHYKNINKYTNGKEWKVAQEFAEHFKFQLVAADFKITTKKYWAENPIKNQLIFAKMIDYCIENNISNIGSGGDYGLDISNAVLGVDLTDARQIEEAFFEGANNYVNIKFMLLENRDKTIRLKRLYDENAINYYYSCLGSGRFNQSLRKNNIEKFGLDEKEIPQYTCMSCRKCCHQLLLLHYEGIIKLNEKSLDHCWKKMYNSKIASKKKFYDPKLPLEVRIKNLHSN